jgi:hypothetical protein
MEKYRKDRLLKKASHVFFLTTLSFSVIIVPFIPPLHNPSSFLPFDSFFSANWYQKSFEASLSAWQHIEDWLNAHEDRERFVFEKIIARLAYADFCMKQHIQEKKIPLEEDVLYLKAILQKIEELIIEIAGSAELYDLILCINGLTSGIIQKLSHS